MRSDFSQQGIALITALLVVALATIIAVEMMTRQQLDIRRTENLLNGDQAYQYALGGERWVTLILLQDQRYNRVDHLNELWATALPPLPIEDGYLQAQLEDLQGRFNLNNLLNNDGKVSNNDVAYFARLLHLLELPPTLVAAVLDWIDQDFEPQIPEGAEDNVYLMKTPAYRTANAPFIHPSELRLVQGFDQESYGKLIPYVTVLPLHTAININTAPPLILMALASEVKESDIASLIAERAQDFFKNQQQFLEHPAFAGLKLNAEQITVNSDFFLLTIKTQVGGGQAQLMSVLQRLSDKVIVISRYQG